MSKKLKLIVNKELLNKNVVPILIANQAIYLENERKDKIEELIDINNPSNLRKNHYLDLKHEKSEESYLYTFPIRQSLRHCST